jgi:hypothetical protein
VTVEIDQAKPRRGAFEIFVTKGGKEQNVWTGVKKGPPRALKWVDHQDAVKLVTAAAQ